jgi:hypothetical protein
LSERRQILLLVAITLVLAVATTQVSNLFGTSEGDAVVTNYTAVFHADGRLEETFTYKLNVDGKRFLYRYWQAPLSNKELNYAQVELLNMDVPSGTFWYLMDNTGTVYAANNIDSKSLSTISIMAYRNEAGAFNPNTYAPGLYTVSTTAKTPTST